MALPVCTCMYLCRVCIGTHAWVLNGPDSSKGLGLGTLRNPVRDRMGIALYVCFYIHSSTHTAWNNNHGTVRLWQTIWEAAMKTPYIRPLLVQTYSNDSSE